MDFPGFCKINVLRFLAGFSRFGIRYKIGYGINCMWKPIWNGM